MSESASAPQEQVASLTTIRRINRELAEIHSKPSPHWTIQVIGDNILEYHFIIRGPPATDFEGGLYHGRLLLPFNYPFAAPSIMLLNPSGRFEVGKKICLSMTSFHSELWQPAWGIRTMMEALRSFFPTPGEGAIGALDWPSDIRKKIASESPEWICETCGKRNDDILPYAEESAVTKEVEVAEQPVEPLAQETTEPKIEQEAPQRQPELSVRAEPKASTSESAQQVIFNFAIYSIAFLIIALLIDIIRNPIS
jgi:ubiquitin-conjugating enzyme E2 J1